MRARVCVCARALEGLHAASATIIRSYHIRLVRTAALASLIAAAPADTLLVVAVQGDAHPLYSLMEAKQRCRYVLCLD